MTAGKPRKVGMLFCEHPDEDVSHEIFDYFRKNERRLHPRVEVRLGNEAAFFRRERFTSSGQNLALSYPGDIHSSVYEKRRAAEIIRWGRQLDVVLSVHQTVKNGDCLWMNSAANLTLRGLSSVLGTERIILTDRTSTISKALHTSALVELGPDSQITPQFMMILANDLARGDQWYPRYQSLQWYEFLSDHFKTADMPRYDGTLPPFSPLPPELISHLDMPSDTVAITDMETTFELARPTEDPWRTKTRRAEALARSAAVAMGERMSA